MRLPYRLDMALDLFDLEIDGCILLVNEADLTLAVGALEQLRACWPEPRAEQVWAVVIDALGRDPRI